MKSLESISYDELNNLSEDDLRDELRKGLRTSFDRIERLKAAGYEDSDYNEVFKDVVGPTRRRSISKITKMDRNELLQEASYVKKHLMAERSSVKGMQVREKRSLEMLNTLANRKDKIIRHRDGSYNIGKLHITRDDVSTLFKIIREASEKGTFYTLKGGSNESVNEITTMVFNEGVRDVETVKERLLEIYKKQQLEEAQKEEERTRRFEEIKSRRFK